MLAEILNQEMKELLKKYSILANSKIVLTRDGLRSENSEQELIQVKEILKDDKFFELALRTLNAEKIRGWINHADKSIFKNKELVKLIALKAPEWIDYVPLEIRSNPNLISEIASMPGVNYENIIDYIPNVLKDEFTRIWEEKNNKKISEEHLVEIKQSGKEYEEYHYARDRYSILAKSRLVLTKDGLASENSKEELMQVLEILKDDKFFEYGLKHLEPEKIRLWITNADKAIFKNKEVVKLIALKAPEWLGCVPVEIRSNPELISEIASMPGVNYDFVIDYIPEQLRNYFVTKNNFDNDSTDIQLKNVQTNNSEAERTFVSDNDYIENGTHYHAPQFDEETHIQLK